MVDVVLGGPDEGGAPRPLELAIRTRRQDVVRVVLGFVALTPSALLGYLRDGPVVVVAAVVGICFCVAFLRGRGPLRLNPYGMSVRSYGRRRSYAWRDVVAVAPTTSYGSELVAVDVTRARGGSRRLLLETYGLTAEGLSKLLLSYRAAALAARGPGLGPALDPTTRQPARRAGPPAQRR